MKAERVEISLKEFITQRAKAENPRSVRDLFEIVRKKRPTLVEDEFIQSIKELKESGTLELELPTPKFDSYIAYVKLRSENAWFHLVVSASLATILAIYILPSAYPIVIFRWILGLVFVLFLPGYATVQALFAGRRELDDIERFALSVGLSLAITPLVGLLLNYTPWGIRLDPIALSLSIYTLAMATIGTIRRYSLKSKDQQKRLNQESRLPIL